MRLTQRLAIPVLAAVLVLSAGWLAASNIGFRVSYPMLGAGSSASGTNWISLAYKPKTGLSTAADVYEDLGGAGVVGSVARYDPSTDTLQVYAGAAQDDFPLTAGEGLVVQMTVDVNYEILGSHQPGFAVTLVGPESSLTGTSQYAYPSHAEAQKASELLSEIGPSALAVSRLLRSTDGIESYTGQVGDVDFDLVRGESYRVQMNRTVDYVPRTKY